MRIAHVIGTFPPHIGGMGRVAYDEATALSERGHDVTVFTMRYPGVDYGAVHLPFKIVRIQPLLRAGDAGEAPELLSHLKSFDVVHLHYPWYGGAEWVFLAKVLKPQRYVLTYHMDTELRGFRRLVRGIYEFFLTPFIFRGAEKVLAVDETFWQGSRFGRLVNPKKVAFLPNSINTEIYHPDVVVTMENNELKDRIKDKRVLLFVGNLLPLKRLDIALRALAALPDDILLVVVGGGYAEEKYRALARELGVVEKVYFVGPTRDELQLARYYRTAEATIVPSESESFSLVALESWATGTPVVTSDLPLFKKRITPGVNGWLFKTGSVEDLTEVLKKVLLMSREELKQIGKAGREIVLKEYSLNKHVVELEKIYSEVS